MLAAVAASAAAFAAAAEALSPRAVAGFSREEAEAKGVCQMRGVVIHVSGFGGWFAVAPEERLHEPGVIVFAPAGAQAPAPGDLVSVAGELKWGPGAAEMVASGVDVIRRTTLPPAHGVKQADFRRGLLGNRRVSLSGRVTEVGEGSPEAGAEVSRLSIAMDNYTACVRVPGRVEPEGLLDRPVRLTGFVRNRYGADGGFIDAELELMDASAIEKKGDVEIPLALLALAAAALLSLACVFLALWLRSRRERRELAVVAAERRRMAADLHDTIEQHLAGANLIAAGVLALEDTPPDVAEAMRTLTGLLANAKAEVRSAVLDLRTTENGSRTLAEEIAAASAALEKTGVHSRFFLRGLSQPLPPATERDVMLILREAVTNAIKHGKARTVLFVSDPLEGGGFRLRVLNDGEPFDGAHALGPETGHYGLNGMRERALRRHMEISWGREGKWTYAELRHKEAKA